MSSSTRWLFYDFKTKKQSNPVTTEQAQMAIFKMTVADTERFFIWTSGWQNWQQLKAYLETKQSFFISPFAKNTSHDASVDEQTVKVKISDFLQMRATDEETQKEITNSITKTFSSITNISLDENTLGKDENAYDQKGFDGDDVDYNKISKPKVDFTKLTQVKKLTERAERHVLKIEVLLVLPNGKTFRSSSQNISLSGALIDDSTPADFVGKTFDIVVIHKEHTEHKFQRVSLKAQTVGQGITQRLTFVEMTDKQKFWLQSLLTHYLKLRGELKAS